MRAEKISEFLQKKLIGKDVEIDSFSTLNKPHANSLIFAKKYNPDFVTLLNTQKDILAIVTKDYSGLLTCSHIISNNPRLDFIETLKHFFEPKNKLQGIHPAANVEESAQIADTAYISAGCYIGHNVVIGDRTFLFPNVVLNDNTIIGSDCIIKSGVVIGQDGFGFEYDHDLPIHFPHFGKVVIGNNVYIGANTCIDRGTLDDTIISDNVKIDNLVHIAHNDYIDENSFIIAGASLGGGVHVGKNCWVAPNVSIKEQSRIGEKSLIGLGAVVIKNVEPHTVVVGNPAKPLIKK